MRINKKYLNSLKPRYTENGYSVPKWIGFCEAMLAAGYCVRLHRSKSTVSKYIYIRKPKGITRKIRFSDHKAAKLKELDNDCDYYVGVGNLGIITTEQLIEILTKKGNDRRTI